MQTRRNTSAGFTLLECLIYCALFSMLAIGTMRVVGEARMVRSSARDRNQLAVIAQSELDKLRASPTAELKAGTEKLTRPEWAGGTHVEIQISQAQNEMWPVEVRARRDSLEGKPTVRLATLVPGAQR